jgi:hypothetical protein
LSRICEKEDAVLFPDRDSKNPAQEPVLRQKRDTEGELSHSPAIAAHDIQPADSARIEADVPPMTAVQIKPVSAALSQMCLLHY